jgi:hypothetical protein
LIARRRRPTIVSVDGRRLRRLALAAVALGCGKFSGFGAQGGAPNSCQSNVAPMPLANIGPDVDLKVLCGGNVSAPVASVSELGAGITRWSVSVAGDPGFSIDQANPTTCLLGGVTIAQVTFQAPVDAVPGDSFDAVVTVRADNDAFAPGTVKVHADVVAVDVTVDQTSVDFGEVLAGIGANKAVTFQNHSSGPVLIQPPPADGPFLYGAPVPLAPGQSLAFSFIATATVPGDYSSTGTWTAMAVGLGDAGTIPQGCTRTFDVAVHARIVYSPDAPDAGAGDGGAGPDVYTGSLTIP